MPPATTAPTIQRSRGRDFSALSELRKRHVVGEEVARRRRVEPVVDVSRAAYGVAGDRRRGNHVRVAKEVWTPRVAVAGAAVTGRRVHRIPQPGWVDRVQRPDGD